MQQDNKHTDKKWQELENQSLPDLSKMDEHWQQMKTMLQPGIVPLKLKSNAHKKFIRWAIAAIFISGLFILTYWIINPVKPGKTTTAKSIKKPDPVNYNAANLLPGNLIVYGKDTIQFSIKKSGHNAPAKIIKVRTTDSKDTILLSIPANNQVIPPAADDKASLNKFFSQLEKQAQQFLINNNRDTVIAGEDGTVLLIPANTFISKDEVLISIKEFYSYQDIITNKLSTLSNGNQLITSGMIHIMATVNGKEVDIQPGRSIRWFVPDTSASMKHMRLFAGEVTESGKPLALKNKKGDLPRSQREDGTDTAALFTDGINWIAQENFFSPNYLFTRVKVLDLRNEPFKTRTTKKGLVGHFYISSNPKINKEELESDLKEKYGYYKVKIRQNKERGLRKLLPHFITKKFGRTSEELGDSTWMDPAIARTYNLKATDTSVSGTAGTGRNEFRNAATRRAPYNSLFNNTSLNYLANRYSVDIRKLGWANCDMFYNDPRPKIDYYVNLGDTAVNYQTMLVFDKVKSIVTGYVAGNKVRFLNVPDGESAKVISIGIQNGKPVSAMESVQLSGTVFNGLKFEETTPAAFKEKAAVMDK